MTFQPPPPPPPPPAGPPPEQPGQWAQPEQGQWRSPEQGQWGPPPPGAYPPPGAAPAAGPRPAVDLRAVDRLDRAVLVAGVLAFVFSFLSYYTYDLSLGAFGSASVSINAWHGFFGWFAMLLALAGSSALAAELFLPQVSLPAPARLIALGAYALATVCVVLALFVYPGASYDGPGIDTGHGLGYWLSLIVIVAGLVLSYVRFSRTGGTLPIGGSRPDGPSAYGPR